MISRKINTNLPLENVIPQHYHHLFLDNSLCSISKIPPCSNKPLTDNDGQEEGQACHRTLNLSQRLNADKD